MPGEESSAGVDRVGIAVTVFVLLITAYVGLEVWGIVRNPSAECSKYGDDWVGEWVSESEPPEGEVGIVCTAPNGTMINDTVDEASVA